MSEDNITSVQIKHNTWRTLHEMKGPGDSFDDVIQRLLTSHSGPEVEADGGRVRAEI